VKDEASSVYILEQIIGVISSITSLATPVYGVSFRRNNNEYELQYRIYECEICYLCIHPSSCDHYNVMGTYALLTPVLCHGIL
jgi:hypothetical protein